MKSNPNTKEIQEALARLEKAKAERANSQRRLSRAREAVERASKDVAESEDEFKAASTNLDQGVRRLMAVAMKKGGSDTSIRLAEIIAQSLGDDDGGAPAPAPAPAPTPAPSASSASKSGSVGADESDAGKGPDDGEPANGSEQVDLLNDAG